MLDLIFVSTLNIANIYHKNNGYFLGFQRNNRSFFLPPKKKQGLVWDSCRDGMRKTVAARGFVNGRGPPSGGRDSVFRCHPDNMVLSNKKESDSNALWLLSHPPTAAFRHLIFQLSESQETAGSHLLNWQSALCYSCMQCTYREHHLPDFPGFRSVNIFALFLRSSSPEPAR